MSIKQQMQDKAAAMAEAMAERARTPQEIEMIRQRVVAQVQSGAMQPYIGVPLIQDLTKKMGEASARMAQMAAGMGAPAAGGPPVAEQVMQQAMQAPQSAGVQALPSNLPQQYAPGGLVAFAEGGEVEHYEGGGTLKYGQVRGPDGGVYETLYDRMNRENREREEREYQERLAQVRANGGSTMPYGEQVSNAFGAILGAPIEAFKHIVSAPGYGFNRNSSAAAPSDAPAVSAAYPDETTRGGRAPSASGAPPAPSAKPAGGIASIPGVGAAPFKMPTLPGRTKLEDYSLGDVSGKIKTATEDAVSAEEKLLKGMTDPSNKAREDRMNLREAANEKDAAINRALSLMSLGFGIAGSKERTLAGALGNEGKQGIADLIRNEAASRAAREKLEDARDLFEQQKLAASKGDRSAAQAAGQRAAETLRQGMALQVQAGHSTNMERLQGDQLAQQGALGLAGLGVQMRGQDIQAAAANTRNALLERHYNNEAERNKAAVAAAESKAYATWQTSPAFRQAQLQAQKLSPMQAQLFMQQEWIKYRANALPSLMPQGAGSSLPPGVRNADDL